MLALQYHTRHVHVAVTRHADVPVTHVMLVLQYDTRHVGVVLAYTHLVGFAVIHMSSHVMLVFQ